jgi:transmembrane sensor
MRPMRETADTIEAQASSWVSRIDRGLVAHEEASLSAWLSMDSRHVGALARARAVWQDLDRAQVFRIADEQQRAATDQTKRPRVAHPRRVAAAIVLLMMGIAGWLWYPRDEVSTAAGEVRQIPLSDGSRVTLDTRTRIEVEFAPSARLIKLESGQALFEVAKDTRRPFIVLAGQFHVRAVGTAFLVSRNGASDAEVTVTKGTVEIWSDADPIARPLSAGGHSSLAGGKIAPPEILTPKELERLIGWRSGMLDLTGKTLAQAATEFNRYSTLRIEIADPQLASETLVGEVSSSDPGAFVEAAAAMLGARVRRDGDRLILDRESKK